MPTLRCHTCRKEFVRDFGPSHRSQTKHVFCSCSCAGKAHKDFLPRRPAKERNCCRCSRSFKAENGHKSLTSCPACYANRPQTVASRTIAEIEATGSGKDRYNRIRQHCREQHADLAKKPCANCGYKKHSELCHVRSISKWSKDTKIATVNARENVVQLCRNCHWEQEHGLLDVTKLVPPP